MHRTNTLSPEKLSEPSSIPSKPSLPLSPYASRVESGPITASEVKRTLTSSTTRGSVQGTTLSSVGLGSRSFSLKKETFATDLEPKNEGFTYAKTLIRGRPDSAVSKTSSEPSHKVGEVEILKRPSPAQSQRSITKTGRRSTITQVNQESTPGMVPEDHLDENVMSEKRVEKKTYNPKKAEDSIFVKIMLSKIEHLTNSIRILDIVALFMALITQVILVVDAQICFNSETSRFIVDCEFDNPLKLAALGFAAVLNVLIIIMYFYKHQITMIRLNSQSLWEVFLHSNLKYAMALEILICSLQPYPFINSYTYGLGHDIIISTFLRAYLFFRVCYENSTLYRNYFQICAAIKYEEHHALREDPDPITIVKVFINQHMFITLIACYFIFLSIGSYTMYIAERQFYIPLNDHLVKLFTPDLAYNFVPDTENYTQNLFISFANSAWCAISSSTTVGYGDVTPISFTGRTIAFMLSVSGIMCTSLMVSAFAFGLNPSDFQLTIVRWFELEKIRETKKEIAARIIQLVWNTYVERKKRKEQRLVPVSLIYNTTPSPAATQSPAATHLKKKSILKKEDLKTEDHEVKGAAVAFNVSQKYEPDSSAKVTPLLNVDSTSSQADFTSDQSEPTKADASFLLNLYSTKLARLHLQEVDIDKQMQSRDKPIRSQKPKHMLKRKSRVQNPRISDVPSDTEASPTFSQRYIAPTSSSNSSVQFDIMRAMNERINKLELQIEAYQKVVLNLIEETRSKVDVTQNLLSGQISHSNEVLESKFNEILNSIAIITKQKFVVIK